MKNINNNYLITSFVFLIMILTSQVNAESAPGTNTNENPISDITKKVELKNWFPIKKEVNGVSRITIGSGKEKLHILIKDDKFSFTDTKGKKPKACIKCTDKLKNRLNLGKNCEGFEKKHDMILCPDPTIKRCISPNSCVCSIGYIDACCSDEICL